ncbi:MAG TPA: AMP-binding protein [Steroidobacteraceae bacterium]|nr:AMP-binding protein [Steroidobacteraceae bacterium]
MDTIALLSHASPTAVVAYRSGLAVTARQFLEDAARMARGLSGAKHVLNICADRYQFAVGLAACLISERVSLLPSTHTPQVIAQLKAFAPDACCLTDDPRCDIDLPQIYYPDLVPQPTAKARGCIGSSESPSQWAKEPRFEVPRVPCAQLAAIVFTSGSTGTPVPYKKTWGLLARCVQSGAPRLGLLDGRSHALVGTVPGQHMYGFESTVLLALLSGNALSAERPFYPADVAAAVRQVPRPRVLVTTPIHLRTLLTSEVEFPAVDLVMSATAPLSRELAAEVEAAYRAPLLEIYGSTETGQIALRRTAEKEAWRLWPGVRLSTSNDQVYAQGGHIEQLTPMCDVIEITGEDEFLLHGRMADLVNVAGKRSSFGYLNAQLNAIPGVVDGAFFLREEMTASTGVARLGAMVVAPGMSVTALTEQLRQLIDPVFLPRPLLIVEQLPRNATGKLPQQALQGFADEQLRINESP